MFHSLFGKSEQDLNERCKNRVSEFPEHSFLIGAFFIRALQILMNPISSKASTIIRVA